MHRYLLLLLAITSISACNQKKTAVVFQSDFGLKDGAVSEMKAIAFGVDSKLPLYDLTHEIPAYNTWEAAYRLHQTAEYWPRGTVFVSVVDPGVGTERKSVVMLSKTGHYFVSPDNGTLQFVAASLGIEQVREIDEKINRRNNSNASYTFHGRDVYAYTAARLASGTITFEQVGKLLPDSVVSFPFQKPVMIGDSILGNIPVLDPQYGNVWTNIPDSLFRKLNVKTGDKITVNILKDSAIVYSGKISLAHTFGEVPRGTALAYMNSLMNFSLALNEASFSDSFKISSGPQWNVHITR